MKILHTADWHIGRLLYGRKRYEEFVSFFAWLLKVLEEEQIDVLLVAGDIFDTTAPSNRSQELYFNFLSSALRIPSCRHILIVGGNHDSPTLLNAPKELLRAFDIHVVGAACENVLEEVFVLKDPQGKAELIACLVPYLRDRDIRTVEPGEDFDEKNRKTLEGIHRHYREVGDEALRLQRELAGEVPIIATGHLFAAGGVTAREDGVRDLYVGTIGQVGADTFPSFFDYVALGHLHVPQKVAGREEIRYSGSPLPMGFGESGHTKEVVIVEVEKGSSRVKRVPVPIFQRMESLKGDWQLLSDKIDHLKAEGDSVWLEIFYESVEIICSLKEKLDEKIAGSRVEILRAFNRPKAPGSLEQKESERLEELDEEEIFLRHLSTQKLSELQQKTLLEDYREILLQIRQSDTKAY